MNHTVRAKTAVGRSMPRPLMRKLIGDDWIANIEQEVARALRQVERDAHRIAIVAAAKEISERGFDPDLRRKLIDAVLELKRQR